MKKGVKNYLIAGGLFLAIVLLTFYIFEWYKVVDEERIRESYLVSNGIVTNEINTINELEAVFSESPSEYFLYISYTNDEDVYNMETKLKKVIQKHNLQDRFYYLNIDDIKEDADAIDKLNNTLGLQDKKISSIPTILYYKDHQLVDLIISKKQDDLMSDKDFKDLLDRVDVID